MTTFLAILAAMAYAGAFTVPISMAANKGFPLIAGLIFLVCLCAAPFYIYFVGLLIFPPPATTIY